MPNIFYKFIHLQMFNNKHESVHLQDAWRQIFVFRKSCLSQKEENSCLWSYGRVFLFSDFQLTRENCECFLRNINKFLRYRTLCKSILKCESRQKASNYHGLYFLRYSGYLSFETLGLDHFGRFASKICEIQVRL